MKRSLLYKGIFSVVSAMLCIIYLNSCSKITEYRQTKKRGEQQKREEEVKESEKQFNERAYRKEAVLLSIRYKVDEDKIFNLLVESQSEYLNYKDILEGKSITRSRLISLSEKYGIPIDILANILIDYYSMGHP